MGTCQCDIYLYFARQFFGHPACFLVPNHRFLFQTEKDSRNTLHRALKCKGVPHIWRGSIERFLRRRRMIERKQAGQQGCIVGKIFLVEIWVRMRSEMILTYLHLPDDFKFIDVSQTFNCRFAQYAAEIWNIQLSASPFLSPVVTH